MKVKKEKNYHEAYVMLLFASNFLEYVLMMLFDLCVLRVRSVLGETKMSYEPKIDKNANANEIFQRLQTFFPPSKYIEFNETIKKGINSRNKFIHSSFSQYLADGKKIPHIEEILKDDRGSSSRITIWSVDVLNANIEVVTMINKVLGKKKN